MTFPQFALMNQHTSFIYIYFLLLFYLSILFIHFHHYDSFLAPLRSSRPTHVRWANEPLTYLFGNFWPSSHRLSRLLTFLPILTFDFWPHGSFRAYENLFWTETVLTDLYKRHFLADWLTFLLVWQGIFSLSYFASLKGEGVVYGDIFCRRVWGVCLSLILIELFFSPWPRSSQVRKLGVNSLKTDTYPLKSMSYVRGWW